MANITVLNRLKMELSNKDYFTDDIYAQYLTENDLDPSAEYVKATMQEKLLYTCLDILEAVSNDIDIMRKLETEFITQNAAYEFLTDRINRIKNRITSLPTKKEDYSPFALMYADDNYNEQETPSPTDIDIQFKVEDNFLKVSVNGGEWQILMDMSTISVDLSNYYTKAEVDNKIASIDLSNYTTTSDVATAITNALGIYSTTEQMNAAISAAISTIQIPSLENYATKDYVTQAIADASTGGTVDLSEYLKKTDAATTYAAKLHTHTMSEITDAPDMSIYATKTELSGKANVIHTHTMSQITDAPDMSTYAKKTDIPTVPTNVSAFTNDANYLKYQVVTSAPETQEEGVLYIVIAE